MFTNLANYGAPPCGSWECILAAPSCWDFVLGSNMKENHPKIGSDHSIMKFVVFFFVGYEICIVDTIIIIIKLHEQTSIYLPKPELPEPEPQAPQSNRPRTHKGKSQQTSIWAESS